MGDEIKEKPILFSGEMVRAILDGRKTQTRRIVKPRGKKAIAEDWLQDNVNGVWHFEDQYGVWHETTDICPYGQPGTRLWVREAWSGEYWLKDVRPVERFGATNPGRLVSLIPKTHYWADGEPQSGDWERPRPSVHMPRWASRITLEITDISVERLQDISEEDAIAEGLAVFNEDGNLWYSGWDVKPDSWFAEQWKWHCAGPREAFFDLWDGINFKSGNGVVANPWVWKISFVRV